MTDIPAPRRAETLRAIGLMVLAMATFALGDAAIKAASAQMPPGQIIALIGGGGALLFGALCRVQGARIWHADFAHPAVLIRNGGEIVAATSFVTALSVIPLALATAIFQSTPLLIIIGAVVFLGERVGPWRWGAVAAGLVGMLVILRPGPSFEPQVLWAFAAVFGMAARDLSTRRVPRHLTTFQLATWAFSALCLAGILMIAAFAGAVWPDLWGWALIGAATVFTASGYVAITVSLRVGEVSAVVPYRYTRILFALLLAMIFFGERPDIATLSGATILVAAGLVTLWREARSAAH